MQHFNDKVIAITGTGSGIGRALALAFARHGAKLALNDWKPESLEETRKLITNSGMQNPFCSAFDVANKETLFGFADDVIGQYGRVDIVINNAGVGMGKIAFDEANLEDIERLFDINFNGVLYGCKAFIPHLLKRPEAVLVNVSSVFGLTGIACGEAYTASKFAVSGLTLSLMQTYRNTNLKIHVVYPGGVKTNIVANALNTPKSEDSQFEAKFLRRSPEVAAEKILKGITEKKSRIFIGSEARLLDLSVRASPMLGCYLVNRNIETKK